MNYKFIFIILIYIFFLFSCNDNSVNISEVLDEDFSSEDSSIDLISNVTAIAYDGKCHISWINSDNVDKSIIYINNGKVVRETRLNSSIYGNYSYGVIENEELVLNGDAFKIISYAIDGSKQSVKVTAFKSSLPIIMIETDSFAEIQDKEKKVSAKMKINNTDEMGGGINLTIKGRGNSSWLYMPKKSYSIKLEKKSGLLGMNKHKSWALIANYADKTLLRNQTAYYMGREIFDNLSWTPDTRQTHLFLNGLYLGLYTLTESVKIDSNRIDIPSIENCDDENSFYDYGYILEANIALDETLSFVTNRGACFTLKEPDGKDISISVQEKIKDYVQKVEDALYSNDFAILESENYYGKYLDVDSFIDWWIVNECTKNVDSQMGGSCFMYFNPSDKKIHMGPLWDFDGSLGQAFSQNSYLTNDFYTKEFRLTPKNLPNYINRLFESKEFRQKAKDRWNETFLKLKMIPTDYILQEENLLNVEANQNFLRWPTLGTWGSGDAPGYESRETYEAEVDYMCTWFMERLQWLNSAINEW